MSKAISVNRDGSALTDPQIEVLTNAVKECEENAVRYAKARGHNKKFNIGLTFSILILSGIAASSSFLYNLFTLEWDDQEFFYKITTAVVSFVLLVLTSVNNVWKPAVKESIHHTSATSYGNLASDIRLELSKGIDDRADKVDEFITRAHLLQQDIAEKSIPL